MEVETLGENVDYPYCELLEQRRLMHLVEDEEVELVFCLLPFVAFVLEHFQRQIYR